jgi:hypothetical protein
MAKEKIKCANPACEKIFEKERKEINRSERLGRLQYCCSSCYGNHRGKNALKFVSEENIKRNQINIKNYCGNNRDGFTRFRYFLKNYRTRGKERPQKKGDIDLEFLKSLWESQKGICPITGWNMVLPNSIAGWEDKGMMRASLDRINSNFGYFKNNVRFVCFIANIAKNNFSDNDLLKFCEAATKFNKKSDL